MTILSTAQIYKTVKLPIGIGQTEDEKEKKGRGIYILNRYIYMQYQVVTIMNLGKKYTNK